MAAGLAGDPWGAAGAGVAGAAGAAGADSVGASGIMLLWCYSF